MKIAKAGSAIRLVAFLLSATVILCLVGFSAGGWQSADSEGDSDEAVIESGDVDENDDLQNEQIIRKYYDRLTGKEVSEEKASLKKVAFVMSSSTPTYGISEADLLIELPTEDGTTRYLCFTDSVTTIGKIGSIAPTRDYISTLAAAFDATVISYGKDDSVKYDSFGDKALHLDLKAQIGYSYTEFTHYVYSNCDLIKAALTGGNYPLVSADSSLPYLIARDGNITQRYIKAEVLKLSFSATKSTELYYDGQNDVYTVYDNGAPKTDLLYDRALTFKNALVLFLDSVTYESEGATELVLGTAGGGRGYYAAGGYAAEILWKNENGKITITDTNGETISVAVGETYIGFLKSSQTSSLTIS